jgi:GT2 family glycosyltransferase
VVVTWQGAHLLGPCLDALDAQTLAPNGFRVLVVDNASTDGTADLLASRPDVQVVTTARNLGFAGGATLGLRQVRTPFSVVLNNDARPDPDWLEHLLAGFGPGVGAVTSKILLEPRYVRVHASVTSTHDVCQVTVDGTDVTEGVVARPIGGGLELAVPVPDADAAEVHATGPGGLCVLTAHIEASTPRVDVLNSTGGVLTPTGHGADRGYLEVDVGQYDAEEEVFAVCGAAAAFRTDVASSLGWFDPWFFVYYEDLDLSWRLRRAGWRIGYAPGARVRHEHAATSRVGSDLFLFHNRRNRLATLARNATARELVAVLAASRRPRPAPDVSLLIPSGVSAVGDQHRSRGAALVSFLARLPHLLVSRVQSRLHA